MSSAQEKKSSCPPEVLKAIYGDPAPEEKTEALNDALRRWGAFGIALPGGQSARSARLEALPVALETQAEAQASSRGRKPHWDVTRPADL